MKNKVFIYILGLEIISIAIWLYLLNILPFSESRDFILIIPFFLSFFILPFLLSIYIVKFIIRLILTD